MQISKRLNLICAAAAAVLSLTAFAADNAAQIKARQALEQLNNHSGAQPAPAPAPSAPTVQSASVQGTAPTVQTAAPVRADSARITKAREALRQKMAEIDSQQVAPSAATVPAYVAPSQPRAVGATPAPAPATRDSQSIERAREALRIKMAEQDQSAPATASVLPQTQFSDAPSAQADAQAEKARQALRKSMEVSAQPPAVVKQAPVKPSKPAPVVQAPADKKVEKAPDKKKAMLQQPRQYEPLQSPPLPFTQEQQTKLTELLRQYRADEITPDQYHAERAKIVGPIKK